MNTCFNHTEKEALSICHGCGKSFCESCLDEGIEYYYCKSQKCQEILKKELPAYIVPESVLCPLCESELELSDEEMIIGKTHCPECDKIIDYTVEPPKVLDVEDYIEIYSSLNQGDIALIKSMLDNNNINYYMLGELFLSVRPLLEPARFFIAKSQIKQTQKLFKEFEFNIFGISTN